MAVNINIIHVCFQLYYPVRYQSELCRVPWITSDGMSSSNMKSCMFVRRGTNEEEGAYILSTTFIVVVASMGICYLYLFE